MKEVVGHRKPTVTGRGDCNLNRLTMQVILGCASEGNMRYTVSSEEFGIRLGCELSVIGKFMCLFKVFLKVRLFYMSI